MEVEVVEAGRVGVLWMSGVPRNWSGDPQAV